MFDQLFGKLSAVVHHRAAPYAAERERFLQHCAQQGYSRNFLKTVAATLLVAAHELFTDPAMSGAIGRSLSGSPRSG